MKELIVGAYRVVYKPNTDFMHKDSFQEKLMDYGNCYLEFNLCCEICSKLNRSTDMRT